MPSDLSAIHFIENGKTEFNFTFHFWQRFAIAKFINSLGTRNKPFSWLMIELGKKESSKGKGKTKARSKTPHNGRRRGKAKTPEVKHSRTRFKACDPFSGRQYKKENEDEVNLEPDESEMEDYVDTTKDDTTKYASYREKPKYRRDSRFGVRCSRLVVFADELSDMKGHKKEKPAKPDLVCVLYIWFYN